MALRATLGRRVPAAWRPHVLDALDERGVARGTRAVVPRPGEYTMRDFTEAHPNSDEVIVQTLFTAISQGTERAIFRGETTWCDYPAVPGYSHVGRVLAAGGHSGPQRGELVATCGPHASIVRRFASEAIRIPDQVPPEHAAFHNLAAVAFQGIRRLECSQPEIVIVLGAGTLGYLAAGFAKAAGHQVTLVNRSAHRLRAGARAGLATFCLADHPDRSEWPMARVVIDLTGEADGAVVACQLADTDALVVLVGSTRGVLVDPPVGEWARKRLTLLGAHAQSLRSDGGSGGWTLQREREAFIDLLADGLIDVGPLCTHRIAPAHIGKWYAGESVATEAVGVLVDWSCTPHPEIDRPSPLRHLGRAARALTSRPALSDRPVGSRSDGRAVRYAVVGCGDIGIQNAKAIEASGAGTVTLAVDSRIELARSLAASTRAAVATDLGQALSQASVDAVVISTPHHLHRPLALIAASAGKHVVVEKPLARNAAEGSEIVAACHEAEVHLTVCYTIVMHPNLQRARDLIRQGTIGRVTAVDAAWMQERDVAYWSGGFSGRAKDDWRTKRDTAGGGVLIMNACHFMYGMDWLVDSRVASARATMDTLVQPVEVEDTIAVSMQYENGVIGRLLATSATAGPPINDLRVFGTTGRIDVLPDLRAWGADGAPLRTPGTRRSAGPPGGRASERTLFFRSASDALLDGIEPPVTGEAALAVQVAIDRSYDAGAHLNYGRSQTSRR